MSDSDPTHAPARDAPIHVDVRSRANRVRARRLLLATIALLYVISVPWYRDTDAPLRIWFGFPDWVAVALGCYIGVAILNAIAWLITDVQDSEIDAAESDRGLP